MSQAVVIKHVQEVYPGETYVLAISLASQEKQYRLRELRVGFDGTGTAGRPAKVSLEWLNGWTNAKSETKDGLNVFTDFTWVSNLGVVAASYLVPTFGGYMIVPYDDDTSFLFDSPLKPIGVKIESPHQIDCGVILELYETGQPQEASPAEQECRCQHLFVWGHDRSCYLYKGDRR